MLSHLGRFRCSAVAAASSRRLCGAALRSATGDFHELRERSLLAHTINASTEGDAASVLNAMDEFWDTYYRSENSQEWKDRGVALDNAVKAKAPTAAMELGTYCGYSAVRIGRLLPQGAQLISIEIDPLYAAIATKARERALALPSRLSRPQPTSFLTRAQVVEHAGLSASVKVEIGSLADRLAPIQKKYGLGPLDVLLMDHGPSSYLGDLSLLEKSGMIKKDTAVLCDWSLYPGSDEDPQAPLKHEEFVKHLSGRGATTPQKVGNKEVFSGRAGVHQWSGWDAPV